MLLELHRKSFFCSHLASFFLILANETLFRHCQPEPSVVHVCTVTSLKVDFTTPSHSSHPYQLPPLVRKGLSMSAPLAHQPYQHPASLPNVHYRAVQCCRARLHVATLCACWCYSKRPTVVPSDHIARSTMTTLASISI